MACCMSTCPRSRGPPTLRARNPGMLAASEEGAFRKLASLQACKSLLASAAPLMQPPCRHGTRVCLQAIAPSVRRLHNLATLQCRIHSPQPDNPPQHQPGRPIHDGMIGATHLAVDTFRGTFDGDDPSLVSLIVEWILAVAVCFHEILLTPPATRSPSRKARPHRSP